MDLKEAIEALTQAPTDEAVEALQEHGQPVFQGVFRLGYGKAKGEYEAKVEQAQSALQEKESAIESLKAEADELRKKSPDLEKLEREKEEALQRKEQEWREKYDALQGKYYGEKEQSTIQGVQSALKDLHVDPFVAEMLTQSDAVRHRVKVQEDGSVRFYQGDKETPLAHGRDENPAKVFARTLIDDGVVPDAYIQPPRKTQNGRLGDGPSGAQGNGLLSKKPKPGARDYHKTKAEFFEAVREKGGDPVAEWSKLPDPD